MSDDTRATADAVDPVDRGAGIDPVARADRVAAVDRGEPDAPGAPADAATAPRRGLVPLLRRFAPAVVMVAVVAFGAFLVARNWAGLRAAVSAVGWPVMLLSAVLAVLGTASVERIWVELLRASGAHLRERAAATAFFVSQIGKYLPGSLWPVVAQMEFGRRSGIARRVMFGANVIMLAVVAATGLLTGAVLLPGASTDGLRTYWWVFLFLPPLLASLHPRTIPWVLDTVLRLVHREPLGQRLEGGRTARAVGWGFVTWALLGTHLWAMTAALGGGSLRGLLSAVGGMALAFAAGLLFPLAPAGAGVRDAVLTLTLTPTIGSTQALAVALASRVILVVADVLLAALGAALGRVREPSATRSGRGRAASG